MIHKRSRSKRRPKLRGLRAHQKRTTVRAIYKAIKNYPKSTGATVRNIHRVLSKNERGRSRRSLSSVKLAIARAVKSGSIRAPKGWHGFRGIVSSRNRKSMSARRSGRPSASRIRSRSSVKRCRRARTARSCRRARTAKSYSRRNKRANRRTARSPSRRGRARSAIRRGARSRHRSARSVRARKNRQYSQRLKRRALTSNSNNSSRANLSDNYNSSEHNDGDTTSVWQSYPCIIS